jgi:hypothetical protein
MKIATELLHMLYLLAEKIIGVLLLAEAVFTGLVVAFLPTIIDWAIALNKVVPSATNADQLDPAQLASLGLANPSIQQMVTDVLGTVGSGSVGFLVIAAMLLGALTITTEHRRGSLTNSALAQPRRIPLLGSKLAALISVLLV